MPNQTTLEANSFSDGVSIEVSTDDGTTYVDLGVMENGYSWSYDFATTERELGNAENPDKAAKNQKVTISPSEMGTWKGVNFAAISGGLMTTETIAADVGVTPAGILVKSGSSSTKLTPFILRLTHWTTTDPVTNPDEFDFRHTIYRVNPDAGGLSFNKNGAKSDQDLDFWTGAFTGEADSSRDDGHQVDDVFYADSVYA